MRDEPLSGPGCTPGGPVSTTSDQKPPAGRAPGQPSTQEIPIAPPAASRPATGGAHLPPPGARPAPQPATPLPMQPTGPVDFVPRLHGPGVPPPPPAPSAEPGPDASTTAPVTPRAPGDRRALLGLGLSVLAVALLEVGLLLPFGGESLWSTVTLWSAF